MVWLCGRYSMEDGSPTLPWTRCPSSGCWERGTDSSYLSTQPVPLRCECTLWFELHVFLSAVAYCIQVHSLACMCYVVGRYRLGLAAILRGGIGWWDGCHLICSNWPYIPAPISTHMQLWGDATVLEGGPRQEANLFPTVLHCGQFADIYFWLHWAQYGTKRYHSRGRAAQ